MKKSSILISLMVITGMMHAQITVTDATFPVAGDTLRTAIDRSDIPTQPLFTPPGGNQIWDLSFLSAEEQQITAYSPAGEGAVSGSFPDAELVTISGNGTETYYDVNSSSFSITGFNGNDPLGGLIPIDMVIPFIPPLPERNAPLNFFDIRQASSGALVGFSAADIPAELLGELPITPDSIRIRMNINLLSVVDAWGSMSIPGGIYDVLRDKRTRYTEARIDAKVPPLGWLDVTDLVIQFLGLQGLGVDTTVTHYFFSSTEKEPIAVLQFNTAQNAIEYVQYKDNALSSAVGDVSVDQGYVLISPNPVNDLARIDLLNFNPGVYTMHLFDIRGVNLMTTSLVSTTSSVPLGSMPGGTYFYQIRDESNRVVARGKVVKGGGN